MENYEFDLFQLCAKIHEIRPENHVQYTGAGMILNNIEIKIIGNLATFGDTKLRFSNSYDLLKNLVLSRVLVATKDELMNMTTKPWNHSHKVKKPIPAKNPNSKRTLKYNASNIGKYKNLKSGESEENNNPCKEQEKNRK
jgi:hypothetical protein